LFAAEDLRKRIFRKVSQPASLQARVAGLVDPPEPPPPEDESQSRQAAFDAAPQPQIVATRAGTIAFVNQSASALLGLGDEAIGRPLSDVPIDVRGAVETAVRDRRRVILGDVSFVPPDGEARQLSVVVSPLIAPDGAPDGAPAGVSVAFEDVTRYVAMQKELDRNRHDLEAAYEELESTIDELETTNEELQSANEELQTTNEELQSTNEELETMNEELQSTNEELETINDELRDRTAELNRVNEFLEVIFGSLGVGVTVVDRQGRVQVWNRGAEDLWGVREEEAVDQHFLALDIGLGPERLASEFRAVIAGGERQTTVLEAINRRGKSIRCAVSVLPLVSRAGEERQVRGAIVLMEDEGGNGTRVETRIADIDVDGVG
jgi:two-component system CheB/CheR fusion protein